MPEENQPIEDDDEMFTVFDTHFDDNENTFCTLDFLGWDWQHVAGSDTVSYGIPEVALN